MHPGSLAPRRKGAGAGDDSDFRTLLVELLLLGFSQQLLKIHFVVPPVLGFALWLRRRALFDLPFQLFGLVVRGKRFDQRLKLAIHEGF